MSEEDSRTTGNSESSIKRFVRFAGTNGMRMVKMENGEITKECCLGCKFNEYKTWRKQAADPCYPCDAHGSMKQI